MNDKTPILSGLDAEVPMHPHASTEVSFVCYCFAYHFWGEKGTRTFRIPIGKHQGMGYQMILCPCGCWHMKPIERQTAENIIEEEKER